MDLGDHRFYCLVFVPYVVLPKFLDVLCINSHDNGFDLHQVNHLLEHVFLPLDLLVLLELEEIVPLGITPDSWVEDLRFGELFAVDVVVPGGELHSGLADKEREEPVLTTPFGFCEISCKGCELLDKVSHRVKVGLLHNCVEWGIFHPPSHYFGDYGHGCRYFRHVCAVCALKVIS